MIQRSSFFDEHLTRVDFVGGDLQAGADQITKMPGTEKSVYQALVTGVRDYVNKNGFSGVVIGLSGGIDSALTLVIAVDALGSDRVTAVLMPSQYTRKMSLDDAREEAASLGVECREISIEKLVEAYERELQPVFEGRAPDTTCLLYTSPSPRDS